MRAFVAVEISDKRVIETISEFQSCVDIDAKAVVPNNLHFTLQFLGEISQSAAEKINVALQTIEFSSFAVNFNAVGAFPRLKSAKVVWIGVDSDSRMELQRLAGKVERVLEPLGFPRDKPFKPHITVFRVKKNAGDMTFKLRRFKSWRFGVQEVSSIKFKKSVFTRRGPTYSDLGEVRAT